MIEKIEKEAQHNHSDCGVLAFGGIYYPTCSLCKAAPAQEAKIKALLDACKKWKEYVKSEEDNKCSISLRRTLLDSAIELTDTAIQNAEKGA